MGCRNSWANLRCSTYSPLGENLCEMGLLNAHTLVMIQSTDLMERKKTFHWQKWCILKYWKHSFKQFYCLKAVYDRFGHFRRLKSVCDKTVFTGVYTAPFWHYRPRAQLTRGKDNLGLLLDAKEAAIHYLKQYWSIRRVQYASTYMRHHGGVNSPALQN